MTVQWNADYRAKFFPAHEPVKKDYIVDFYCQGISAGTADKITDAIIALVEADGGQCAGRVKDAEEGEAANG